MIKRNLLVLTLLLTQLWTQARMNNTPDLQKQRLSFIENKGQVRDQKGKIRNDIDFILQSPGMTLFVGKGVLEYQFAQKQPETDKIQQKIQSRTKFPSKVPEIGRAHV